MSTSLSMYQALVPVATRQLRNLSHVLAKGQAHCQAHKIDPQVFLQARIFPDMFPLVTQVRIAGDMAKGAVSRLAGVDIPRYEDNETTFDELQARIARTVDYISSFTPDQINGTEDRDIQLKLPSRELHFKGVAYLTAFVLPNMYFHCTTAYNLLRHGGVPLGKMDFLGAD